ncbi:hypothetical protein MFMK1_003629 [Metallumcola ferriviriculae]|uniref:Uncharacterized protein n=1 Tax=Metallumcola ferriviriculae TaxID=3039180 RepID=A0AAU0UTZ4_9FIRM|nr:hypothetical protein MFMK1_003629 [Desulfitibacteraceae bacterium MK1]
MDYKEIKKRMKSPKYLVRQFVLMMLGGMAGTFIVMALTEETVTLRGYLYHIIPFLIGGIFGMVLLYFIMNDKRFD